MFGISAVQMILYVLVGNYILQIQGMTFTHWFMLFSTSCFANMLGLNISASFNSAKVIYILIPILIIPQLLFSGVIVKFDKLHPWFSSQSEVPLIGNVMASRWAYEAMAVAQYKDNAFERREYEFRKNVSFANWKKDLWIKEIEKHIQIVNNNLNDKSKDSLVDVSFAILHNEVEREMNFIQAIKFDALDELNRNNFQPVKTDKDISTNEKLTQYLGKLKKHYKSFVKKNEKILKAQEVEFQPDSAGKANYLKMKLDYTNESLEKFVTNKTDRSGPLVIENNYIVQKADPIYLDPYDKGFFGAHFYAPRKRLFGVYIDTFWANAIVIWGMTLLLGLTLYIDLFKKLMNIGSLFGKKN
jgi:hypothetical protein